MSVAVALTDPRGFVALAVDRQISDVTGTSALGYLETQAKAWLVQDDEIRRVVVAMSGGSRTAQLVRYLYEWPDFPPVLTPEWGVRLGVDLSRFLSCHGVLDEHGEMEGCRMIVAMGDRILVVDEDFHVGPPERSTYDADGNRRRFDAIGCGSTAANAAVMATVTGLFAGTPRHVDAEEAVTHAAVVAGQLVDGVDVGTGPIVLRT